MNDDERTQIIRKELQASSKEVRIKFPFLLHQDLIGFLFFSTSIFMILAGACFYLKNQLSAVVIVFWVAFWTSILHELEHDLIHFLYFKKNKFMQNMMMLGVWIFRPLTINPWIRRNLHFHHHLVSGTRTDFEERGVTNGEKWGFRRLLTTADLFLGGILRSRLLARDFKNALKEGEITPEQAKQFKIAKFFGMMPFTIPLYLIGYAYILGVRNFWIEPLVMILFFPNLLRMFCLHFITSNLHYYGDVKAGNIMQQTQIFNAWIFAPLNAFCFNFGSTHAIHHFWVTETFYIRQFTAPRAHQVMKAQGVRFNDLGTFFRSNRFTLR